MPVTPIDTDQIVITASRLPDAQAQTPASVTVIDRTRIERLGDPLVRSFIRLVPSASVSSSGPAGSFTEVRIRGAEANHTLLFIDGIRANDPATGDQPRFDLLNADIASRIEVVRGPQSALWGSDAIGGVVAINGVDGITRLDGSLEGGSFGFGRGAVSASTAKGGASFAASVGWQRATGIDSFDGHGDEDGYRNVSGRVRGTYQLSPAIEVGAAGFGISARSEFDGFGLAFPFEHTDTLDSSRNRFGAARLWANIGNQADESSGRIGVSLLGSSNRNFLAQEELNRTSGTRRTIDGQLAHRFSTGPVKHVLIVAADAEHETFTARDSNFFGATDQDRRRNRSSVTIEWRGQGGGLTGDLAVRRDMFSRFRDATSLRASLLGEVGHGFSVAGSYAEGIAQPAFFDLFGFFPGTFVGNTALKPESSHGFEISGRYGHGAFHAALTAYRQTLHDEIVDNAAFTSTVNAPGTSRRWGVEGELGWQVGDRLRVSANYAYLHATEPAGVDRAIELRRPRHSGSVALDGTRGQLTYGASLSFVGRHLDRRDIAPYDVLRLRSYWLGGARVAYQLRPGFEMFARVANAFASRAQDVAGYRTEGRSLYGGIRLFAPR